MLPPPHIPLQHLIEGLTVDYPLDNYPAPWAEIFTTLQAVPPLPSLRQGAFKAVLASLPDDAVQHLEDHLKDPHTFGLHIKVSTPQARLLLALEELAPTTAASLARHLKRDYANIFRSLQKLVSLGLVTRHKNGPRVYYHLAQPQPVPDSPAESRSLTADGS